MNKEPKTWITTKNGVHVPIFDGESKSEAIDRSFSSTISDEESYDEYGKSKDDFEYEEYEDYVPNYFDKDKQKQELYDLTSDIFANHNLNLSNDSRDFGDSYDNYNEDEIDISPYDKSEISDEIEKSKLDELLDEYSGYENKLENEELLNDYISRYTYSDGIDNFIETNNIESKKALYNKLYELFYPTNYNNFIKDNENDLKQELYSNPNFNQDYLEENYDDYLNYRTDKDGNILDEYKDDTIDSEIDYYEKRENDINNLYNDILNTKHYGNERNEINKIFNKYGIDEYGNFDIDNNEASWR